MTDRTKLDAVLAVAHSVADRLNGRARKDAAERITERSAGGTAALIAETTKFANDLRERHLTDHKRGVAR